MIHGVLQFVLIGMRFTPRTHDFTIVLSSSHEHQLVISAMTDGIGGSAPSIGNAARWSGRGSSEDGFHRSLFAGAARRYASMQIKEGASHPRF